MKGAFFYATGICLVLSFNTVIAQAEPKKKEVPVHPVRPKYNSAGQKRSINSPNPYPTMKIDENDQYMGREGEFLNIMNVSSLPADFPKYDKSMGLGGYNNTVEYYFKQHQDLLKDKWKEKMKHN